MTVSVYVYSGTNKIALIENEYGTIYVPKPVNWAEKQDLEDIVNPENDTVQLESGFDSIYKETNKIPIYFSIDGKEYITYNHLLKQLNQDNKILHEIGIEPLSLKSILIEKTIKPYQMNDYDLYTYFENLDIETCNIQHYHVSKNLMIDRGLLEEKKVKITPYEHYLEYFTEEL